MNDDQTIYALASAVGRAGVSVFRVSGRDATRVILELCVPQEIPIPRMATLRSLIDPKTKEVIDRVLILFFKGPQSFTGEDVVEIHTHGGRAVAQAVSDVLSRLSKFRIANAGEFTRRAFEHDKMDLTEAEAVADLVHAETEAQRKQALRQLDGALGALYGEWRQSLSRSLAYMEAAIDFSDEELPIDVIERQTQTLHSLREKILHHLNDGNRGERVREGFSIAIIGPPNAGKSSLLNVLAKRDAAIVSPVAGTTRDVIEVYLDIAGFAVTLADTAGLRESSDVIEGEGIRRALAQADRADLKVIVFDGATWPLVDDSTHGLLDHNTISVINKSDLLNATDANVAPHLLISVRDGEGIETLLEKIAVEIRTRISTDASPPLTRARHREALEACAGHLDRALQAPMADLRAEDVRLAMRALGSITGQFDVEDLLEIIFRDFCIGK